MFEPKHPDCVPGFGEATDRIEETSPVTHGTGREGAPRRRRQETHGSKRLARQPLQSWSSQEEEILGFGACPFWEAKYGQTVLTHIVAAILTLCLVNPGGAAPTANDATEADVETALNGLELPIDLHHVDVFVETVDGLYMQVDYRIAFGHVTIALRMDEDGPGVARLTLDQRVLAEQEFVDGEVTTESTAFGALTDEEAHLLIASVYQVWDHDVVIKALAETRGLLCGLAAGISGLAIAAGVFAGCELATVGLGTAACVGLSGGLGTHTGAIVHDKCKNAQN